MKRLIVVFIVLGIWVSEGKTEPIRFSGTVPASFNFFILQNQRTQSRSTSIPATKFISVSLDAAEPTSFYHELTYSLQNPATLGWTESRIIPGTFDLITIATTVTFDPFTMSKTDYGPLPLLPLPGYSGVISEPVNTGGYGLFDPITVSGSYSISGPTEVISDTFSHTFQPQAVAGYQYDVTAFPVSVAVKRRQVSTSFNMPTLTVFSGTVDGVPWDIQIDGIKFDGTILDWGTIPRTPEPSTFALLSMGAIVLLAYRLRRHWRNRLQEPRRRRFPDTGLDRQVRFQGVRRCLRSP